MRSLAHLLALAVVSASPAERACNNSPKLCTQPYGHITHLGAHNSSFLRDASTSFSSFGNHFFNTTVQLDAGVRLLSAQVHVASSHETKARELHLCHSSCELFDVGLVHEWLWEIRVRMDAHPNEVVTLLLINVDSVDAKDLQAEYSKADIAHYGWVPSAVIKAPELSGEFHEAWPTMEELIDGERLVSFVNPLVPDAENAPYLLNEFDFLWENAYDVTDPTNFTCTPD